MATDESSRVEFKLRCNETAIKPEITFEKSFVGIEGSPDEYIFNVQTRNVCLRPTVTCEASYFRPYLRVLEQVRESLMLLFSILRSWMTKSRRTTVWYMTCLPWKPRARNGQWMLGPRLFVWPFARRSTPLPVYTFAQTQTPQSAA